MSKGNSGLLSKFQTKVEYTSIGVLGPLMGHEVLTEVVVRVKTLLAKPSHTVIVKGRMSLDTEWEVLGSVKGNDNCIFHIASWDYIQMECITYDCPITCTLLSSAYFNDGIFAVNAINTMNQDIKESIHKLTSEVCDIKAQIETIKLQIEFITDHESYEVE